ETLGAQLLLLDVARAAPPETQSLGEVRDEVARWSDDLHVGVFRYAWWGRGTRPADTWLITDWQQTLSRSANLEALERGLGERRGKRGGQPRAFAPPLPVRLKSLELSRRP